MIEQAAVYGVTGAALVGLGLYGFVTRAHLLRRILAFNLGGSGIFLIFGAIAARGPGPTDPVPQALIITGIVVAFAATALAVALVVRLTALTGTPRLPEEREVPPRTGEAAKPEEPGR